MFRDVLPPVSKAHDIEKVTMGLCCLETACRQSAGHLKWVTRMPPTLDELWGFTGQTEVVFM